MKVRFSLFLLILSILFISCSNSISKPEEGSISVDVSSLAALITKNNFDSHDDADEKEKDGHDLIDETAYFDTVKYTLNVRLSVTGDYTASVEEEYSLTYDDMEEYDSKEEDPVTKALKTPVKIPAVPVGSVVVVKAEIFEGVTVDEAKLRELFAAQGLPEEYLDETIKAIKEEFKDTDMEIAHGESDPVKVVSGDNDVNITLKYAGMDDDKRKDDKDGDDEEGHGGEEEKPAGGEEKEGGEGGEGSEEGHGGEGGEPAGEGEEPASGGGGEPSGGEEEPDPIPVEGGITVPVLHRYTIQINDGESDSTLTMTSGTIIFKMVDENGNDLTASQNYGTNRTDEKGDTKDWIYRLYYGSTEIQPGESGDAPVYEGRPGEFEIINLPVAGIYQLYVQATSLEAQSIADLQNELTTSAYFNLTVTE